MKDGGLSQCSRRNRFHCYREAGLCLDDSKAGRQRRLLFLSRGRKMRMAVLPRLVPPVGALASFAECHGGGAAWVLTCFLPVPERVS